LVGLAIGDYFSFASFAILGARLGSIFATLSPAFVFIIATLFIDEKLNMFGILGIAITLLGVTMVVLSKHESMNFQKTEFGSYKRGLIFGVLSALCQSIGVVLSKYSFENQHVEISSAHASFIRMIGATVAAYIAVIALGKFSYINKPLLENKNNGLKFVFLGTLCGPVVGMMCSMYALSHIDASVAQTIFSLVPVFVLFLNYLFYKEKISMRSLIGAIVAIAGVYVLVFRNSF
jgi:drug/metabolite transporter (DMT)-like permease